MQEDQYKAARQSLNAAKYKQKTSTGHYESYFLRANHPCKPLAFWIRYTSFVPSTKLKPEIDASLGELWCVFFDGERNNIVATKNEFPLNDCFFSQEELDVSINCSKLANSDVSNQKEKSQGILKPGIARGRAANINNILNKIEWNLSYQCKEKPLLLLPEKLYQTKIPKAKALVANPLAVFNGVIKVNSVDYNIEDWIGSENHNWGSQHTDQYAWGQVAGFDDSPSSFFECATARIKIGPFMTPKITTMVLRHEGQEYAINSIIKAIKAKASYNYFNWKFESSNEVVKISGEIKASKEYFVGLNYYNPPGGSNTCLNSKIASCRLIVNIKGKKEIILETKNRAAFEILTADNSHGVSIVA